jgi:uncharacterized integral membrane protein
VKYLLVALLASAITVFALQNNEPTAVRFLLWSLDAVPLATIILVSVAAGLVLGGFPLMIDRWRLRSRNRGLEHRLNAMETERRESERRELERRDAERRDVERREAERRAAERHLP